MYPNIELGKYDQYILKDLVNTSGAVMITSGLALHICACALLILQPHSGTKKMKMPRKHETEAEQSSNMDCDDVKVSRKDDESVKHIITIILTNFNFILFFLSTILFLFGSGVVFTHIVSFAASRGISKTLGNAMVSAIGISMVVGRFLLGLLSQRRIVNILVLHGTALFICGLSTIGLAVWSSPITMMIFCCVYGVFAAAIGPTLYESTHLLTGGVEYFKFSVGFVLIACALGWLMGPPAAGLLYEATGVYPNAFYLAGASTMLGSLIIIPTMKREY